MELPQIASEEEWKAQRDELLAREKASTRTLDKLAAERRRLPMVEISTTYEFDGPDGRVGFLDLFEGRSQLLSTTSGPPRTAIRAAVARCSRIRSPSWRT